ncbi:unnamed protein product [Citrullus colocynthis]|uniref:Uncharacterized protein n=1 Tax=Citrullus colocynthis TaxID=252529 RepID=A0ABP0YTC3_9ROSI
MISIYQSARNIDFLTNEMLKITKSCEWLSRRLDLWTQQNRGPVFLSQLKVCLFPWMCLPAHKKAFKLPFVYIFPPFNILLLWLKSFFQGMTALPLNSELKFGFIN